METAMVKTENLSKKYPSQKERWGIHDFNMEVKQGTLYGLIGPDGAGKSTTLRILGTVIKPTYGEAWIDNINICDDPERIRPFIGYMPQIFSLYQDLSVIENLKFFADINQVPVSEQSKRIELMLDFTALKKFQNRRARNLSGGMKKKLALACSLIHNPKVLILDEPSTGVDPVSRRELWRMLSEVVSEGVTVVVSTPYMDEADRCSEVAILYEGKIIVQGKPEDLKDSLPFEMVEVKSKPRKAARKLVLTEDYILDWRPVGDRLRIAVKNGKSDYFLNSMEEKLNKDNAEIRILRRTKPLMEDVFTYQVKLLRK